MHSSKKQCTQSGFTLIELLVVVSIIAILAGIILANLSASRTKGNDAAVKTNMSTIQTQGEVYFDQHGDSYGSNNGVINNCKNPNTLFSDPTITGAITQITTNAASAPTCLVGVKDMNNNTPSSWALSAPMKSGHTWCVDSGGYAGQDKTATQSGNSVSCT